MKKNPETTTTTTTPEEKEAAKAKRENVRARLADSREAEKILREGVRLDTNERKARREIAKAKATGRVSASFARLILRMEPVLILEAKNPAGLRTVLKNYAAEIEKDKNAREFRAPSKGLLEVMDKIRAEAWDRVQKLHAEADATTEAYIAAL